MISFRTMNRSPGRDANEQGERAERDEGGVAVETQSNAVDAPLTLQTFGVVSGDYALAIEAILLTVDRPIPASRLAQALGIMSEEDAGVDSAESSGTSPATTSRPSRRPRSTATGAVGAKPRSLTSPLVVVREAIEGLNKDYEATGRAFRIEQVAGGYRVMTLARFASVLEAYHGRRERASLSKAAVETLAVIAYKQPMTRSTLESIRGVASGEILRSLMERRLVTIVGRAEELGRPILYGTSKQFLDAFGLASLRDLPSVEELTIRPSEDQNPDE